MTRNPLPAQVYQQRVTARAEDLRGPYLRDQTAIIHSLPFRRLKHKTQVFFAPENDHICTRIEHVMHVATIAETIARGLNAHGWQLNEELAFAIGLGHDLGHAPFGHSGEHVLDELVKPYGATFLHEVNGLRVVDHLANDGAGLNLTLAVRDGIICHNGEKYELTLRPDSQTKDPSAIHDRNCRPSTYEGCIVRFSDKIAYLGRDLEDGMDAGLITMADIPSEIRDHLGSRNGEIINALVCDVIERSKDGDEIRLSDEKFALINALKKFNYSRIYLHPKLLDYVFYCRTILTRLFEHLGSLQDRHGQEFAAYAASPIPLDRAFGVFLERMQPLYQREGWPRWRTVTDYISGMTDLYALTCIKQITLPPAMAFHTTS